MVKWAWHKMCHFNYFYVNSTGVLSTLTLLCGLHHHPSPELFIIPNLIQSPLNTNSPCPFLPTVDTSFFPSLPLFFLSFPFLASKWDPWLFLFSCLLFVCLCLCVRKREKRERERREMNKGTPKIPGSSCLHAWTFIKPLGLLSNLAPWLHLQLN